MQFNGRDTEDANDDVMPNAVVRVIDGIGESNWNKAYVIYDKATGKPIKGNGILKSVKNYYVCINDGNINISTDDINIPYTDS